MKYNDFDRATVLGSSSLAPAAAVSNADQPTVGAAASEAATGEGDDAGDGDDLEKAMEGLDLDSRTAAVVAKDAAKKQGW